MLPDLPQGHTVRVIEYTVHTSPDRGGDGDGGGDGGGDGEEDSSEVFALVTDLLDVEAHPALDLRAPTQCAGAPRR